MTKYNLDYLKDLAVVKNDDFERSHESYRDINSKAFQISTVLTGFYASLFVAMFVANDIWTTQDVVLLTAALPGIVISIFYILKGLKKQPYVEAMDTKIPPMVQSQEEYLLARIKFLQKAIDANCSSNSRKSKYIGLALTGFVSALIAFTLIWVVSVFFYDFGTETSIVTLAVVIVIGTVVFFAAKHIGSLTDTSAT